MNSGVRLLDGLGLAMLAGLPPDDRRRELTLRILPDRPRGVVLPSSVRTLPDVLGAVGDQLPALRRKRCPRRRKRA
jgi:hypothetical protein